MIIINATLKGENTYDITVGKDASYRVSAFDFLTALDLVADYIEAHSSDSLCTTENMLKLTATYSGYDNVEEFAEAHNLTRCGTNGIYLEITNVKGCPNG